MPRNNMWADSRFQMAVEYLQKNSNLTVWDVMKLADFSPGEQNDKAKYMIIRLSEQDEERWLCHTSYTVDCNHEEAD
jgi:hypothetical protein